MKQKNSLRDESSRLLLGAKRQRQRVDAVAGSCGGSWSIIEHVPEVAPTLCTCDFGALHAMRRVAGIGNGAVDGFVKAGPATASVIFCI